MTKEELIEKYLSNALSGEELVLFEEQMKQDEAFKKEVQFQLDVQRVSEYEDDTQFKKQLVSYENPSTTSRRPMLKWMAAAAIVVALGTTWWLAFSSDPNEELFAQYFEPYRNVVAPVVRGEVSEDLKSKAFSAYENGNFDTAVTLFSELIQTDNQEDYKFYLAVSHLAQKDTEKAISLFSRHISNDGQFKDKAKWYLGLSFLVSGEKELARQQFQQVIDSNAYNTSQAAQLLRQLKK